MNTNKDRNQQKRNALAAKLRHARHALLGNLWQRPSEDSATFNPLNMFLDPAAFENLQTIAMARIRRDHVGHGGDIPAGYTRPQIVAAAQQQAWQSFLSYFLDRDYAAAEITEDERTRAILSGLRIMQRRRWRTSADLERDREGMYPLWNRAQDSRTPDPRRMYHAAEGRGLPMAALTGEGTDDEPTGQQTAIKGGQNWPRGPGYIESVDREVGCFTAAVILDGLTITPTDKAEEYAITERVWRMKKTTNGTPVQWWPCTVDAGRPAATNRHQPQPLPQPWSEPGHYTTRRETQPTAAHTAADGIATLRRWGQGYDRGAPERVRLAAAIRRLRG